MPKLKIMPNTDKNTTIPQCDKNAVMQSVLLPNELRIGNLVTQDNELINGVTSLTIHRFDFKTITLDPIPLTEEWLSKIGYELTPSGTYLQPHSGNFIWFEKGLKCCIAGEYYPENIKYIHQLQNLHYALTQRELTVA